jgi:hypothetical protein
MRFCFVCDRAMVRGTHVGRVMYRCSCGCSISGTPHESRLGGASFTSAETTEMYGRLISNAPFDRTGQLVQRDCPDCGLNYMTLLRIGAAETVIMACKCGYRSK